MNTVTIEFDSVPQQLSVYHNDIKVMNCVNRVCNITLDTDPGKNQLRLANLGNNVVHINSVAMFDMGKDKLVYLGLCHDQGQVYQSQDLVPGATWVLEYEYPVFTWLHQTLNFGWLIAPDQD